MNQDKIDPPPAVQFALAVLFIVFIIVLIGLLVLGLIVAWDAGFDWMGSS